MFLELNNPPVSYETYNHFFNTYFNISFDYTRIETCCCCDQFLDELKVLQIKISDTDAINELRISTET